MVSSAVHLVEITDQSPLSGSNLKLRCEFVLQLSIRIKDCPEILTDELGYGIIILNGLYCIRELMKYSG